MKFHIVLIKSFIFNSSLMDYLFGTSLIIIIIIGILLLIFSYLIWNLSKVFNNRNMINMLKSENVFKRKGAYKKEDVKSEEKIEHVKQRKNAEGEQEKKVIFFLLIF
jgi:FtsZ-interacting cell division protein ZipA